MRTRRETEEGGAGSGNGEDRRGLGLGEAWATPWDEVFDRTEVLGVGDVEHEKGTRTRGVDRA
jgi:hypothetical protein